MNGWMDRWVDGLNVAEIIKNRASEKRFAEADLGSSTVNLYC